MKSSTRVRAAMRAMPAAAALLAAIALSFPVLAQSPKNPRAAVQRDWADGRWRSPLAPFRAAGAKGSPPNLPSFTPKAAARWKEIQDATAKGQVIFDPGANCAPLGIPVAMIGFPFEILFSDGRITFIYEETGVRRIYTDGRKILSEDDRDAQYVGHAIGRWEGDTLVVNSTGFRGEKALDVGMPHSDKLATYERWRKKGANELEVEITFTDAEVLAKPWKVTRTYQRARDIEIAETVCTNNRNPHTGGVTTVLGPDGKPITVSK